MIKLGDEVKCKVTGFKGIAVARYHFLSGCNRYAVQPKVKRDGTLPEEKVFDEPVLEAVKKKVSIKKGTTGGPAPYLPTSKDPKERR
jgi:hypothetical protein